MAKSLSPARFDLYVLGARLSPTRLLCEELSSWSNLDETVLGMVNRDRTDQDYGWVLFARDAIGRFRAVDQSIGVLSERQAVAQVRLAIAEATQRSDLKELGRQGDEPRKPADLLAVPGNVDPESLHPSFRVLREQPGYEPARAVVRELAPWLAPADPHFVREFQRQHFDQRLWEFYLWAAFRDIGFDVEQLEAPDFLCRAPGIAFTVEATTVAPSRDGLLANHPNPKTDAEMAAFLADYMPQKYGSALWSKLNHTNKDGKHYWELEEAKGKPFVLAIADFHKVATPEEIGSMVYTQSALEPYLYGHRAAWEKRGGELTIEYAKVAEHRYRGKAIPSGFFEQPGAEHVSAVLFSNAGTIAKFARMGVTAGFGARGFKYLRHGVRYDPDPTATEGRPFLVDVSDPKYEESWSDELQVYHNPHAATPLPREWVGEITHHHLKDGELRSAVAGNGVVASITAIVGGAD